MTAVEITDEAIEAAVVAFRDAHAEGVIVGRHEKAIRAVLEAALPHLAPRPVVDRETLAKAILKGWFDGDTYQSPNDCRRALDAADAVLALLNGTCTCPTDADVTPEMRSETGQHLTGCPMDRAL